MTNLSNWRSRIGQQRDWVWRGWQIRYSYIRADHNSIKPPIIFIHGFGAAIEHWRNNLAPLAQHHTVYAIDLVGFGASRKAQTDYKISLWAEQIYDFWQTFIRQPVILVGNSTGSLVCLACAANYRNMVQGIVMISLPDATRGANLSPRIAPWVRRIENLVASPLLITAIFKIIRRRFILRQALKLAYPRTKIIDSELVEIVAAPPQDLDAHRTFNALFRAVRLPEFAAANENILPQLDTPILLVWGKCDRVVPPQLASFYAGLNPRIRLVEIEQAGHCVHDELPHEFNTLLLQWLETLE